MSFPEAVDRWAGGMQPELARSEPRIAGLLRIGQVALPQRTGGRRFRTGLALLAAVAAHGLVAAAMAAMPARDAVAPRKESRPLHVVEIASPPPPPAMREPEPPPPPQPAPPKARTVAQPRVAKAAPAPKSAPPEAAPPAAGPVAPAMAGQVVAAPAEPEILDFTSFDIATGQGEAYAGGITHSAGTNRTAVRGGEVALGGAQGAVGAASSKARSVSLSGSRWDCPWPDEARSLAIREQEVLLRAEVRPDGRAVRVEILADPGHGFGEAARRCALQARFEPALDDEGNPIASVSPPIRVRFTR